MSVRVPVTLLGIKLGAAAWFAVSLLAVSPVHGQPGGGMFGMMRGATFDSSLLVIEEVQKELELTEEQISDIVPAAQQIVDDFRAAMRELRESGGGEEEMEKILEEFKGPDAELVAKLDDKQKTRLKQLRLQRLDTGALDDPEVQEALDLTEEQKTGIEEARTASTEKMQELFQSGDREGMREKMTEIQAELKETIMGLLTDEQKAKLDELRGEEFKFPERRPRGGGRSDF